MQKFTEREAQAMIQRVKGATAGRTPTVVETPKAAGPIIPKDRFENEWERQYASYLEQLRHLKQIIDWQYENIGFRIGEDCFHYPDFFITFRDHFEIHDIKGQKRQNWVTKVKACKERYPFFLWAYVKKEKGGWAVTYI